MPSKEIFRKNEPKIPVILYTPLLLLTCGGVVVAVW